MKETAQTFVDWLAIGSSLAWLAGVALLFTNSALTQGWMVDFAALVALGLAAIWAIWWLIRGSVLR
jgi:hypothetical protein